MVIDAHVHFWKFDKDRYNWITNAMDVLRKDYLPDQLLPIQKRNGIDGVIAVQAEQAEVDTRFLVELSETYPMIKGVIGWVDLGSRDIARKLDEFAQYPIIKGWRHSVREEAGNFWENADFRRGIQQLQDRNYTFDLPISHHQWPAAAEFIAQLPHQKFVVDHCGSPDIRHGRIDEWKTWIREYAKYQNVYCKLSGLFTEAAWKEWHAGDFYPYLDVVFEAFGVGRLMYGSDWPVILLSGMYVQWKSLLEKYMEDYSVEEKEQIFGLNAAAFYGIAMD